MMPIDQRSFQQKLPCTASICGEWMDDQSRQFAESSATKIRNDAEKAPFHSLAIFRNLPTTLKHMCWSSEKEPKRTLVKLGTSN